MKKYLKKTLVFVFLFALSFSFAQEKKIAEANKDFDNYAFIDAREAYLKVAEDGYRNENLLERLGDSYYFTADYKNAAKWYGALYDTSENIKPEYLYRFALSLKSNQQYDASNAIMEEFLDAKGSDYRAKLYQGERNYLSEIEQQSGRFEMINIGFNSALSDFAPSFYQGNLVISSNRSKSGATRLIHDWNDQPFLDLYFVPTGKEDSSDDIDKMTSTINTKYHESTSVFSKDGTVMYFTRNNYTEDDYKSDSSGTNRLKLYRAKKNGDGKWKVSELPFNNDEYSVAHPALSKDGKTLYFSSDMPGGKGMSDLYKVSMEGDGFGTPVSLGDGINTEGRDTFPFISSDDRLYFASDGHVGLGGLDVFVTDMVGEGFGNVYNVGRPINSPVDDFTFIINGKTGIGYFASNRDGGAGDDDIYNFKRIKASMSTATMCTQKVEGSVLDKESNEAIAGAKVMLLNDSGDVIETALSGADGSFSFIVACSKQYAVRSSKTDYTTAEKPFATPNVSGTVKKTLFMSGGADLGVTPAGIGTDLGLVLGLNPIYFDLDKSNIRYDAEIELRKVIAVMKAYPTMKIEVRSHTDSRADDGYNMALSERRAASTVEYLVNDGGIDRSRLTSKGYGETVLTNGCVNGATCSEGAHQLNRRSEFIIIR